ncbi:hypothetical protein C8R45DRAFT_355165 [Mycena sanguinolenta]|nr:hypothetical protein C8R45DRAFT_355165 [Mycena sanguinolenta]
MRAIHAGGEQSRRTGVGRWSSGRSSFPSQLAPSSRIVASGLAFHNMAGLFAHRASPHLRALLSRVLLPVALPLCRRSLASVALVARAPPQIMQPASRRSISARSLCSTGDWLGTLLDYRLFKPPNSKLREARLEISSSSSLRPSGSAGAVRTLPHFPEFQAKGPDGEDQEVSAAVG